MKKPLMISYVLILKRILLLLKAGKPVIQADPPGVGKTDLAKRILETVGKKLIGNDGLESVASDEWGPYDLIGGLGYKFRLQE